MNAGRQDDLIPPHSAEYDIPRIDGEIWRDSEGDRLNDFGVDEDAEFYDDENIPLAELLRRRHDSTNHHD